MSKPIVIGADTHLQDGFRAPDVNWGLKQIETLAADLDAAAVILAGDVHDSHKNPPGPVNVLHRFLDELYDGETPFFFVRGQHDGTLDAWAAGHRWAQHLHKRSSEIAGVRLYGLDFQPPGRLQEELDQVPEHTDLLILHNVWADWMGEVASPQGSFADIPHVPVVVTGDLHQCRIIKTKGKSGQNLTVGSPGATCRQAINEPAVHYVFIYEDGKLRKHQLTSRRALEFGPLVTDNDVEQLLRGTLAASLDEAYAAAINDGVPADLYKPYLRITYGYKLANVVRRVERLVNNRALMFWNEIPPEREASTERTRVLVEAKGGAVTPLTLLPDFVNQEKQPAVFELVSALLSSPEDQEGALTRWRTDFMAETTDGGETREEAQEKITRRDVARAQKAAVRVVQLKAKLADVRDKLRVTVDELNDILDNCVDGDQEIELGLRYITDGLDRISQPI